MDFPSNCVIRFRFLPLQAFGMEAGGGLTCVRGTETRLLINFCTGAQIAVSTPPLEPLHISFEADGLSEMQNQIIELIGNIATVQFKCESLNQLDAVVQSLYYALPILLNLHFADPPYIDEVEGEVGSTHFGWHLSEYMTELLTTTQDEQCQHFVTAWSRMHLLNDPNRRLAAACHYFHIACRLNTVACIPGEFLAENILNLCKTLEVLFPNQPKQGVRDGVRSGLKKLGFSDLEIERDFMPAMALRNELDVGHVMLDMLPIQDMVVIHDYCVKANRKFQLMLRRALNEHEDGSWRVEPYISSGLQAAVHPVIDKMRKAGFGT